MKRSGFTMIELIFVIVILGILAAVAIPKLAATRDDAKVSAELTNAAQVIQNIGAEYTAQGSVSAASLDAARDSLKCFDLTPTTGNGITDGNLTIAFKSAAVTGTCPQAVLDAVTSAAHKNGLIPEGNTSKTYVFGGSAVKW